MVEKIKDVHPPRGLARLAWRAPIWLYRLGLGGLLGERFVLLNHIGRKSGQPRQAVLEVVFHDPESGAYLVAAGFGEKSDWYQNVMAHPEVLIQVGRKRTDARAERLPVAQATQVMLDYNRHHPAALRTLAGILGYRTDGSQADVRYLAGIIPIIALTPQQAVSATYTRSLTMTQTTTFALTDPDGFEIFVYRWAPPPGVQPKAVVQLAHGAAEHALRYERFARYLNQAGYVVYANDHRGHWKTAGTLDKAGIAGEDGWNGMVRDLKMINDRIRGEYSNLPLFFFGHSMGSFLGQRYIQLWGKGLAGVVLSGTTGSLGDVASTIALLEQAVQAQGRNAPSELFIQMFAGFSAPFPPVKTGFEWLSREKAEVQKYVDDPWCGFPFTNGLVLDMFKGAADIWSDESESRIPKDLPVLLVSGALDPVGANTAAVNLLAQRYQAQGIRNLTAKFYEGARHELLNETNRDEVQKYILDWLEKQMS